MSFDGKRTGPPAKVVTADGRHRHKVHRHGIATFTPAEPDDLAAITEMFQRCSPQSRLRRFFRLVPSAPFGYLEAILADPDKHEAYVIRQNGETIGLAELHRTGPWSGDLAIAVEDAFQRQGLGTAALDLLMCRARKLGLRSLSADVQLENSHVINGLRRVGTASMRRTHDVLHIEFDLEAAANPEAPERLCAS